MRLFCTFEGNANNCSYLLNIFLFTWGFCFFAHWSKMTERGQFFKRQKQSYLNFERLKTIFLVEWCNTWIFLTSTKRPNAVRIAANNWQLKTLNYQKPCNKKWQGRYNDIVPCSYRLSVGSWHPSGKTYTLTRCSIWQGSARAEN